MLTFGKRKYVEKRKFHIGKEAIDINDVIIENKQHQINITLQ